MEKSLKSITQYTTNDPISLQNSIALQVYNHGDLPLKINGIVIMPKETFPLVTPDGCLAENYQVTPEFFDLDTIAFYFPTIDAKSLTTTPKFTLLSSVFDGVLEKKLIGLITVDGEITILRNDFTNDPNDVFSFVKRNGERGKHILKSSVTGLVSLPNAVMFIGESSANNVIIEQYIDISTNNFIVNTYKRNSEAYESAVFTNNSIMIIQTIG